MNKGFFLIIWIWSVPWTIFFFLSKKKKKKGISIFLRLKSLKQWHLIGVSQVTHFDCVNFFALCLFPAHNLDKHVISVDTPHCYQKWCYTVARCKICLVEISRSNSFQKNFSTTGLIYLIFSFCAKWKFLNFSILEKAVAV